jgi:hypothetical protein
LLLFRVQNEADHSHLHDELRHRLLANRQRSSSRGEASGAKNQPPMSVSKRGPHSYLGTACGEPFQQP